MANYLTVVTCMSTAVSRAQQQQQQQQQQESRAQPAN